VVRTRNEGTTETTSLPEIAISKGQ